MVEGVELDACQQLKVFWSYLTARRKRQLATFVLLLVLASFAEVLSLGAVLPFLGVLTEPENVYSHSYVQPLLVWLQIDSPKGLLLPITLGFIVAALVAGGMRLALLYVSSAISFSVGADFSQQIYRTSLYQPYAVHLSRNTSQVISTAINKVDIAIYQFLLPVLQLMSSSVILLVILSVLLYVSFWASLVACIGFALIYGIVIVGTRNRLSVCGKRIAEESSQVVRVMQEGLGGIRDVIIDHAQEVYCQQYERSDNGLRYAQAVSAFIGGAPRYGAEALGMVLIAILAFAMANSDSGLMGGIVILGVLAMGAQRLLPLLQQSYSSITLIRGSTQSVKDVLELLKLPDEQISDGEYACVLPFQHAIELRNLGFRYSNKSDQVLSDVSLTIGHGSRVGFIGSTGSGKSTLLDIVMGLLSPTQGEVRIDGIALTSSTRRAWQRRVAHVPQSIYLSDASIAENIAFAIPVDQIDLGRVRQAAKQAQLADYIESLPNQYQTDVGERGVRLSGGQRQRIGIARALYKQADVIIFDEATSALDSATEQSVMAAIDALSPSLTVLIIAHRLTTLQHCAQIVELKNGGVARVASYSDIINEDLSRSATGSTVQNA